MSRKMTPARRAAKHRYYLKHRDEILKKQAVYNKGYYQKNKAEIIRKQLAKRKKHRSEYLSYMHKWNKQYYQAHAEERRAASLKYYWDHRDDPAFKAKVRDAGIRYRSSKKGKAWYKAWRPKHRKVTQEMNKRWRLAHLEETRAMYLANQAERKGILKRQPCEVCGREKTEKHHEDYSKPLDVRWLCRMCHRARHSELKKLKKNG